VKVRALPFISQIPVTTALCPVYGKKQKKELKRTQQQDAGSKANCKLV
jgi:hypothetical protein